MQIHHEKWVFSVITDEINKWDPLGLLALGAPENEFRIEAARIQKELPQIDSRDELAAKIQAVFSKSFDKPFPWDDCLAVANLIWNRLNQETSQE